MGTMPLSLTGFAASDPVPGTYIEVKFAQGEILGNPAVPKVLFIGTKTSAGSATNDSQVYALGTVQDAIDYFGTGSPIHRMMKRFSEVCKSALCYGISPTESAGVNASDTVTFVGVASGDGICRYTLCGETIEIPITNGEAIASMATALSVEINKQTHWPVTSSPLAGVVTVTARIKGTNGNSIRHRATITSGITTTVTCAAATLAAGAADEAYATTLQTILPEDYDYIVPGVNHTGVSDARVGAVEVQISSQALPVTGIRQQVIVGYGGTPSNAVTFAAAANGTHNNPRMQVVSQENPEWEPMEIAAHMAAIRYNLETGADPGVNYDSYGLDANDIMNIPAQYSQADRPTRNECSTMISGGVTPIAVSPTGKTYIVRSCTASTDVRVRDTSKVTVSDRFADDLGVRFSSHWSRAKVADDPASDNVQFPATVATPKRVKSLTIVPLYLQYAADGLLDPDKTTDKTTGDIVGCATGIDPVVTTRINARCPIHVTPLLHQFAALVSENSSG